MYVSFSTCREIALTRCVCVCEIDEVANIEAYLNLRRYPEHDLYT